MYISNTYIYVYIAKVCIICLNLISEAIIVDASLLIYQCQNLPTYCNAFISYKHNVKCTYKILYVYHIHTIWLRYAIINIPHPLKLTATFYHGLHFHTEVISQSLSANKNLNSKRLAIIFHMSERGGGWLKSQICHKEYSRVYAQSTL